MEAVVPGWSHASLREMDEETFLSGGDGIEPDIDDIFGKDWTRIVREIMEFDPRILEAVGAPWTCDSAPGYRLQEVEGGVVVLDGQGNMVGGYVDADLSVDLMHQGQGLGAELVLARYVRSGGLPTWNLDEPAYSRAGAAAHRAAWRLGRTRPDLMLVLEERGADAPETPAPSVVPGR